MSLPGTIDRDAPKDLAIGVFAVGAVQEFKRHDVRRGGYIADIPKTWRRCDRRSLVRDAAAPD